MRSSVSDARNGALLPIRAITAPTSANEYITFILPPSFCYCIWGFFLELGYAVR